MSFRLSDIDQSQFKETKEKLFSILKGREVISKDAVFCGYIESVLGTDVFSQSGEECITWIRKEPSDTQRVEQIADKIFVKYEPMDETTRVILTRWW